MGEGGVGYSQPDAVRWVTVGLVILNLMQGIRTHVLQASLINMNYILFLWTGLLQQVRDMDKPRISLKDACKVSALM